MVLLKYNSKEKDHYLLKQQLGRFRLLHDLFGALVLCKS